MRLLLSTIKFAIYHYKNKKDIKKESPWMLFD